MTVYSKDQPKSGDVIGACEHIVRRSEAGSGWGDAHWFRFIPQDKDKPLRVLVFNIRTGAAKKIALDWLVMCPACFAQHAEYPEKCAVGGVVTWGDDEPVIRIDGAN